MLGQDARTQRVQGSDGRRVELGQRGLQALHVPLERGRLVTPALADPAAIRLPALVAGDVVAVLGGLGQRPQQLAAQALAQLGRGGIGEGADHDLARRELPLQQQAQVERGDGPGLAGAGAGLHQTATAVLQGQAGPIHGPAHAASWLALAGMGSPSPSMIRPWMACASCSSARRARLSGSVSGSPKTRSPSSSCA